LRSVFYCFGVCPTRTLTELPATLHLLRCSPVVPGRTGATAQQPIVACRVRACQSRVPLLPRPGSTWNPRDRAGLAQRTRRVTRPARKRQTWPAALSRAAIREGRTRVQEGRSGRRRAWWLWRRRPPAVGDAARSVGASRASDDGC